MGVPHSWVDEVRGSRLEIGRYWSLIWIKRGDGSENASDILDQALGKVEERGKPRD